MDENKLTRLREIGYTLHRTCNHCEHGQFNNLGDWGTCVIHDYKHKKHSGSERRLSINRCGKCPKFKLKNHTLGEWEEFFG